jgi:hypothetical protein
MFNLNFTLSDVISGSYRKTAVAIGTVLLSCLISISASAQETAQEQAAMLRERMVDLQAKQADLQTQVQQVEEYLKPENIEHSLAGVGSTHPEELREARRRQLEIQRQGIQTQLDSIALSRTRLEAAIARADAESYWQSARGGAGLSRPSDVETPAASATQSQNQNRRTTRRRKASAPPQP